MAYLSHKGLQKLYLFFEFHKGLYLWAIFIYAIHLIIAFMYDKKRLEWDPNNGDSWPN